MQSPLFIYFCFLFIYLFFWISILLRSSGYDLFSATIDINSSFEHHHDLKIAYYRLSFIHSDSRLKSGNSSFAELEYQSVDKLTLFFMCDWISITSISFVKFSNWSIQFFNYLTSTCVTYWPCVLILWPHVTFCSAGCIDKLSLQRLLGTWRIIRCW